MEIKIPDKYKDLINKKYTIIRTPRHSQKNYMGLLALGKELGIEKEIAEIIFGKNSKK